MNALLLTAHDFRTPKKANMHFIAAELAKRGTTRFVSLRYSHLSRLTRDPRTPLDARANRVERIDGVDCFLWKAGIHPFNTRRKALRPFEEAMFRWSKTHPPRILVSWLREADVVFFESGSAVLFVELAARLNPAARRIYIASDDLATIDAADFVKREFTRVAPSMDALCLPSPRLADNMPPSSNKFFVPHGIDHGIAERAGPNPYTTEVNAVSVGSMLFDRKFFEAAAPAFPHVAFHVIGSGLVDGKGLPDNVKVYRDIPYDETLAYIKHARVGIAPYRAPEVPAYLTDTSMKLMQYRFFGVPAVCPASVTGGADDRFGYEPGSAESIGGAMRQALGAGKVVSPPVLGWDEVTDRLLAPAAFADTRLAVTGSGGRSVSASKSWRATPQVSVVMPYLRAAPTIARAIDSVLSQSLADVELIAVSDGSIDGSHAIVEDFAARDARVHSVRLEQNRGPSTARNRAIDLACGTWIAVLDADDAFESDRLATLVEAGGDDASVVVDNLQGIDPIDASETGMIYASLPSLLDAQAIVSASVIGSRYDYGYLKPLVRRASLETQRIRYQTGLRVAEDLLFLLECSIVLGPVRTVDRAGYRYTLQYASRSGRLSPASHSVPGDRAVAEALRGLVARRGAVIDRSLGWAIERRCEALERGADVSSFRHAARTGRLRSALGLAARSHEVRSYLWRKLVERRRGD